MMKFNKKRLTISIVFGTLVILLMIFIKMDVFTLSRFESVATAQNSIRTAVYLVDDEYQTITVQLPDVIPSNNQYLYTFSVSNFNATKHSDTNLRYRIHVRTTTNIEIDYELYDTLDIDEATSCVDTDEIVQDYYGTHFRHLYTDYSTMLYTDDATDYYTILFTFPDDFKDSKYSGLAEMIEINIESNQILDSDT